MGLSCVACTSTSPYGGDDRSDLADTGDLTRRKDRRTRTGASTRRVAVPLRLLGLNNMRVIPRYVGLVAVFLAGWRLPYATVGIGSDVGHVVFTVVWVAACLWLTLREDPRPLAAATLAAVVWPIWEPNHAYVMLGWFLVVLMIGRDDDERARLVRWLVTSIYVFVAVTKLNPTWLDGTQLAMVVETRPHLDGLDPALVATWAPVLSLVALAVEATIPVLLWRWPKVAVPLLFVMHSTFAVAVQRGPRSFSQLVVLNGLPLVGALAFLEPRHGLRENQVDRDEVGVHA